MAGTKKSQGNPLDSSQPGVLLKGRQRTKRPTRLKQEVLKLREAADEDNANEEPSTSTIITGEGADPLNGNVVELLKTLKRFQDRMHAENPVKAHAKRRLVYGMREVQRDVRNGLLRAVLVADDVQTFEARSTIDTTLSAIEQMCGRAGIPFIRALSRRSLSRILKKSGYVSVVGIVDFRGAENIFAEVLEANVQKLIAVHINQLSLFA
ncbi:hypothetical protein AAVH_05674 [Aphelenchoides avenae]|nr:hypothetical protein AAVH_05674 [Aphelenchus avenae]